MQQCNFGCDNTIYFIHIYGKLLAIECILNIACSDMIVINFYSSLSQYKELENSCITLQLVFLFFSRLQRKLFEMTVYSGA